ncbi:hypothetical protein FCIRC_3551 [Fusarium circinatum]|uniref:Uncharacterized protein n=1 Tax=Fusarium circinatum TaxID=48490 RepID=A0A8H5X8F5_FUSCI|nr:hypothetical protein FCIRC_3551 [Fusarium circinatum]
MTSSHSNATPPKKGTGLSAPMNPNAHGSQEQNYTSPMLQWLRQSDKDEPWRGFTVATDRNDWQSHASSAQNGSETWSTQAEVGSQAE